MTPESLNQFLLLYSWFPLAALLFFLLLIARFYHKFSGERIFFRFFALPIVGFGLAAMRAASIHYLDDPLINLLNALSGLVLLLLCARVYQRMLHRGDRRNDGSSSSE